MLKKYVRRVLLPLLFSFCCVFSGFLSVRTFAYTSYDFFPAQNQIYLQIGTSSGTETLGCSPTSDYLYEFANNPYSGVYCIQPRFGTSQNPDIWRFAVDTNVFDYYLVSTFSSAYSGISIQNFTFFPTSLNVMTHSHSGALVDLSISDVKFYHCDVEYGLGFSTSCKLDLSSNTGIARIQYWGDGTLPKNLTYEAAVIALPKDTSAGDATTAIVNAINNQTNQLSSDIGQATDDIQQSIEDQFSGEPEEEFNIDDVVTEHTEKMGVLSFGSDVMVQFLDMFQSANAGTAELTLPGFNITVQNVEYQVWPDYSFNFNQIDTWVPGLMSIIRVILPAFVWLKVLGYCITVFEKNFLSNNGG